MTSGGVQGLPNKTRENNAMINKLYNGGKGSISKVLAHAQGQFDKLTNTFKFDRDYETRRGLKPRHKQTKSLYAPNGKPWPTYASNGGKPTHKRNRRHQIKNGFKARYCKGVA